MADVDVDVVDDVAEFAGLCEIWQTGRSRRRLVCM